MHKLSRASSGTTFDKMALYVKHGLLHHAANCRKAISQTPSIHAYALILLQLHNCAVGCATSSLTPHIATFAEKRGSDVGLQEGENTVTSDFASLIEEDHQTLLAALDRPCIPVHTCAWTPSSTIHVAPGTMNMTPNRSDGATAETYADVLGNSRLDESTPILIQVQSM